MPESERPASPARPSSSAGADTSPGDTVAPAFSPPTPEAWRELQERVQRLEQENQRLAALVRDTASDPSRAEERPHSQLFEAAPDAVFLVAAEGDDVGRILDVNEVAIAEHGYSKAELLTMRINDLDTPECARLVEPRLRQLMESGRARFEVEHRRKDGTTFPVEVHAGLTRVNGVRCAVSFNRDITERKQAQRKVQESEQRLQTILDHFPGLVSAKDIDGRILLVNQRFDELDGPAPEGYLGRTVHELFPKAVADELWANDLEVQRLNAAVKSEEIVRHKDGTPHTYLTVKFPLTENQKLVATCAVSVDITKRKQLEALDREHRTRIELAATAGGIGFWDWDVPTNQVFFSPEWKRQLGYEEHEIPHQFAEWEQRVHPDDLARSLQGVTDYLNQGTKEYRTEFRLRHKDGSYRWIFSQGQVLRDDDGTPRRMLGCHVDVTERKAAEEALRLAQFTLDRVALAIFWVRPDASFLDVNDAACQSLGYTREELLRLRVPDVDIHYSDERWPAHWSELRDRKTMTFTSRKRRKDGSEFDVEINANWLNFGGQEINCAFVQDITERLRKDEALRSEAERLQAIFSTEPECIKTVSPEGCLLDMNPAGLRLIEAESLSTVIRQPVLELVHPEDRAPFDELHRRVAEGGTGTLEFRIIGLKGTSRWMETHSVPLRGADGRITSVLSITRDITSRRQVEEERAALSRRLQQSQKLEAIGTLAGGIAHDFNNILGAIFGYLDLAEMDLREGLPASESLAEIRKASDRAKALVRQILTFSRQEAATPRLTDLSAVVADAARFLRATISTVAGIEVSIDPGTPLVSADANQLHQVLVNLGTNAWHALGERPGLISIRLQDVYLDHRAAAQIDGLTAGRHACIAVCDTGSGIDAATLPRIFDPFFTTKQVGQGTGLGLAVVHGIVRGHHGGITVESTPGQGSTFRVYLPAAPVQPADSATNSAAPGATGASIPGRGEHILLIDDETPLNRAVVQTLQRLGYRVTSFEHPALAIAAFRENPSAFQAIITDFEMPGLTGVELAAEMLRIRAGAPVLLFSGLLSRENREAAEKLGIRAFLPKPCDAGALTQALSDLFHGQRQP